MILDLFRKDIGFDNIQGYDDIKNVVRCALSPEENYKAFCHVHHLLMNRSYSVNVSATYKNTFKHLFPHTSPPSDVVNKFIRSYSDIVL